MTGMGTSLKPHLSIPSHLWDCLQKTQSLRRTESNEPDANKAPRPYTLPHILPRVSGS